MNTTLLLPAHAVCLVLLRPGTAASKQREQPRQERRLQTQPVVPRWWRAPGGVAAELAEPRPQRWCQALALPAVTPQARFTLPSLQQQANARASKEPGVAWHSLHDI